jgi:hypothetical protein
MTYVKVLLDFLALMRFLVLIISVHKLFDVCREVFALSHGFNAVELRSVIARRFRELLVDMIWLFRPLWTFDWQVYRISRMLLESFTLYLSRYRYITAVAAYLVFIPLEMIAQILAPLRVWSADANALPASNPKLMHYILGRIQAGRSRFVHISHTYQRLLSGPDCLCSLLFLFSVSLTPQKTT